MRGVSRIAILAVAVAATASLSAQQPAADPDLDKLLAKATWYAIDFVDKLSNVVAEERYLQDSNIAMQTIAIAAGRGRGALSSLPRGSATHRELKSDFLIVSAGSGVWTAFRDVFEVDHVKVRDRDERLAKLFLNDNPGGGDANAKARAIVDESGRYNLGAVQRTINNPVFALTFLQPNGRTHFKFTAGKPDRKMGSAVRVVDYVEEERPTIISGAPGQDMPAFGRFWIEVATGRVVKAEVRVDQTDIKANLTTTFRRDARLGIDVPDEFREDYDLLATRVTGVATYARFRKFDVKSSEEVTR